MSPPGDTTAGSPQWSIELGNCRFDPVARALFTARETVPLTPLESGTLLCLGARIGETVSIATLAREVWAHHTPFAPGSYRQVIRTLRRKLAAARAELRIITVRPRGYALRVHGAAG